MANKKSAEKRNRQSVARRMRNRQVKSEIRTAVKKFLKVVGSKDKAEAEVAYKEVQALLDGAGSKGILHKNSISRKKSRLVMKLNALA